ncbi:type VI secretion system contractile sheath small subunit, partial [Salmonella enterica subsp. enterica serovar Anatum]|nr:type VI secretion system contractile sheath small subunit [Salmonella enterica subsp. enterica serovar Anatum]
MPFVMAVLADLAGKPREELPPVTDRKFLDIDIDNFNERMKAMGEIVCEVKMIPNQIAGRGCQCQRLVKVVSIDSQLYRRLNHN